MRSRPETRDKLGVSRHGKAWGLDADYLKQFEPANVGETGDTRALVAAFLPPVYSRGTGGWSVAVDAAHDGEELFGGGVFGEVRLADYAYQAGTVDHRNPFDLVCAMVRTSSAGLSSPPIVTGCPARVRRPWGTPHPYPSPGTFTSISRSVIVPFSGSSLPQIKGYPRPIDAFSWPRPARFRLH